MDIKNFAENYIQSNGIKLYTVQAGPQDGPLLILLHGFPEFWYGWRKQLPFLAQKGFLTVAPDQRGYNLSEKPKGVLAYDQSHLVQDILGVIDYFNREKAFIIGHDWGAAIAWHLAQEYPERIEKMAILNVPHHKVFRDYLKSSGRQKLKSWYIMLFQIPWLPEFLIKRGNWKNLIKTLQKGSREGTFSEEDFDKYKLAWSQPGAFKAMIHWYRAAAKTFFQPSPESLITVPTLMIWGEKDKALSAEMAQPSIDLCTNGKLVYMPQASHWVHHEEAEQVNQMIWDFFK